jgi:two-component system phosphate regulon sensor histidine kinase PhoR
VQLVPISGLKILLLGAARRGAPHPSMQSHRLFWKLLFASAGLNLIGCVVFASVLFNWHQTQLLDQIDRQLRDAAILVRGESAGLLSAGASDELQEQVRQFGQSTGVRFTLISPDGSVLADSEIQSREELAAMENHRDRPEVARARVHGEGSMLRTSATLGDIYRYFALRADVAGQEVGYVRSALPVSRIDSQLASARRVVWGLAAAIFLTVLLLSYWIIGQIVKPVEMLSNAAQAIAAGDYEQRVYIPSRDELGAMAVVFNRISQDLSSRMQQLGQSHERHATALGGMIEGVIAVDARQRIVLANKAAGRLFDFRPAAAEGRPLLEVVRNHALDQAVSTALASGQPQRLETRREGSERLTTDIHVTPLAGDPCPGVVLVMHDTTELRRLESLRRDFIANVSHELKTPLSAIKACAETLRNGALADPDAAHRFLARIEEDSDRLHKLILDMLSLARIESGKQAFDIGSIDVAEVARACVDAYRHAADAKRITLATETLGKPCCVQADREALRQILDNLVDNAIKYTPEGGKVSVRWTCDADMARIDVQDSGVGIGERDLRRVFERFYRIDKARSRELGGTGLGLSIVKHLAQTFGGKVVVQSELGMGSTFTVYLPTA